MMDCTRGNRCARCLKLDYKRRAKEYQSFRKAMFEDSDKDALGNLIVYPTQIQTLLNKRAKIGRAYRRWKRKAQK